MRQSRLNRRMFRKHEPSEHGPVTAVRRSQVATHRCYRRSPSPGAHFAPTPRASSLTRALAKGIPRLC